MKTEEMTLELASIRRQITNLGYKHLQSILPVSLGKVEDKMQAWSDAEEAIDNIIKSLEK